MLSLAILELAKDPWVYLNPSTINKYMQTNAPVLSGIYVLLRTIGLAGVCITLGVAFLRLAWSSPRDREEAKKMIGKKLGVLFLLFSFTWIAGIVIGILLQF